MHCSLLFVPTCSATSAQFPSPYISVAYKKEFIEQTLTKRSRMTQKQISWWMKYEIKYLQKQYFVICIPVWADKWERQIVLLKSILKCNERYCHLSRITSIKRWITSGLKLDWALYWLKRESKNIKLGCHTCIYVLHSSIYFSFIETSFRSCIYMWWIFVEKVSTNTIRW